MDITKKIKRYLIIQGILVTAVVLVMMQFKLSPILFLIIAAAEGVIIVNVVLTIMKPLNSLQKILEKSISAGELEGKSLPPAEELPFLTEIMTLLALCAQETTRKNSAEIFDKQAELTALQSQINPHFLYNTLESARGQALIDGNIEIAKMMEALSAFFRYSISRKGSLVRLRDELANIENYMMIQRYRFNNRFTMEILIDEEDEEAYDYKIPKLIIQPVVENAIFHGLEESLEGGIVSIEVIVTEKNLIITVSDNGKGMDAKTLADLNHRIHTQMMPLDRQEGKGTANTGIGLLNIHKRIQLLFGEEYGLSVYSTVNQGTDVEITVPVHYERVQGKDEKRDIAYTAFELSNQSGK